MIERQLTFDATLNSDRKLELHIPINASVRTKEKKRLSRQAQAIYERLQEGPVTTGELSSIACQYCARVNEIRHAIIEEEKMIDVIEGESGKNTYYIVPLERSAFWQRIKEKGEAWKWIR